MKTFTLQPRWNFTAPVEAQAIVDIDENFIFVEFCVKEAAECFCGNFEHDGEAVWNDSCVEIFLKTSGGYANFEFNSKGACFAAVGENRENRVLLTKDEYAQIIRDARGVTIFNNFYEWSLSVKIPRQFLGTEEVKGNLYKCADKAFLPHYFSAFPINTPKPDFHKPWYFKNLF